MSAWFRTPLGILACPPKGGFTSLDYCMPRHRGDRSTGQMERPLAHVTLVSRDPWRRWLSGVNRFKWTNEYGDAVAAAIPTDVITKFKTRPIAADYFRDFYYQITLPLEMYGQGHPYIDTDQHYTSASRYLQDCGFDKPDSVISLEHTKCYLQQFSIDYKIKNVELDYRGISKQEFAQLAEDTYILVRKLWKQDFQWRNQAVF